jgi:hypothetical protein
LNIIYKSGNNKNENQKKISGVIKLKNKLNINSKAVITLSTVATVMFLSAGCGTKTAKIPSKSIQKPNNIATNIMMAPKELDKISANSEKVMKEVDNKNWSKAQEEVKKIEKEKKTVSSKLRGSSRSNNNKLVHLNNTISKLKKAVMKKDALASKLEANKVKKVVPDIKDTYKNSIPTDIERMDAMARDVVINLENKDKNGARKAYKDLNAKWTIMRGQLGNKYKTDVDKFDKFSTNLARSLSLDNKDMIKRDTENLLSHLKVIKNDFTTQNKK